MERPRHRRTGSLAAIDGNLLIQNQRVTWNFVSESCSCNGIKGDMLSESVWSSSKHNIAAPIRKFLAEDMSKETEAKRRSPSVIAKLMGLDGLPSPQRGHTRSYSKRSSTEQKDFKDVYEDLEASHVANDQHSTKWSSNSKLRNPEMSAIQQNFSDRKCLPNDGEFHALAKFSDNVDAADSDGELLRKFLQQPDSLFSKRVVNLLHDPSSSLRNHIAILKPSSSEKYESNAKAWKSEGDCVCNHESRSHRRRKDGLLLHTPSHNSSQRVPQSPVIQLDEARVKQKTSTRIVLLKPGKTINALPSGSLDSSLTYLADASIQKNVQTVQTISGGNRASSNHERLPKPKSRVAREVVRKITQQMRENLTPVDVKTVDLICSNVRGYAGDESSYDAYESDSDSSSDGAAVKSRKSFGCYSHCRGPAESSMNREAKKRLSERLIMAHEYQKEVISCKGNTLGEMLAIPDRVRDPGNLDAARLLDEASNAFTSNGKMVGYSRPWGISSRDGWKDGCLDPQPRSRSVPPSLGGKNQKRTERHKGHTSGRYVNSVETVSRHNSIPADENLSHKRGSSNKELRSGGKRRQSCQDKFVVNIESVPGTIFCQTNTAAKLELSAKQPLATLGPEFSVELLSELSASTINNDDSFVLDQEDTALQESSTAAKRCAPLQHTALETSESSKEAEHPSPISVLEVGSSSSGPESLSRVFDGFQELCKKVQLLKMDLGVDADMSVVTNDDVFPQIEENPMLIAKGWEDLYLFDILHESGLEKLHLDIFTIGWQSLQCPVGASVFDTLEKKYSDGTTGGRSERRLLFDRVNSALLEIFRLDIDTCPWAKPAPQRADSKWQNFDLKYTLMNLLESDKSRTERSTGRMLDIEMEWSSYKADIEMVGKDIEKRMTDELILEVVSMLIGLVAM